MLSQTFRTKAGHCNARWLSDILDIPMEMGNGIDLHNDYFGIEIKSKYDGHSFNFACATKQIPKFEGENKGKDLYWAFMVYGLDLAPKKIKKSSRLEDHVTRRDAWILPWDWVKQFPVKKPRTGPFRYIKMHDILKESYTEYPHRKGTLYLPQSSPLNRRITFIKQQQPH